MYIENIFPEVIGEKSTLKEQLKIEGAKTNFTQSQISELVKFIPEPLISSEAFLDKLTNQWRYEFGLPYDIENSLYWGTHMWIPVKHLLIALQSAMIYLPKAKLTEYLARLANASKHQSTLVEMIPAQKLKPETPREFEVAGLGSGNHTVDWVIQGHDGRTVMLDVKRRVADFINQAKVISPCDLEQAPSPSHDPKILFKSIESKFKPSNPNSRLQGAWIVTDIKQNSVRLKEEFMALDETLVHFVIIGDWDNDAHILVRNSEDYIFLQDLFQLTSSERFTSLME